MCRKCFLLGALFISLFSVEAYSSFFCEAVEMCRQEQKGLLLFRSTSHSLPQQLKEFQCNELKEHLVFLELDPMEMEQVPLVVNQAEENFFLFDEQQILIAQWQLEDLPPIDQIVCLFLKHCQLHRQLKAMTGCLDEQPLKALYQTAVDLEDEKAIHFILQQGLKTRDRPFFLVEQYKNCIQKEGVLSQRMKKQKEEIVQELSGEESLLYTLYLLEFQELSKIEMISAEVLVSPLKSFLEKFPKGTKDHLWRMQMMIAEVYVSFDQWNFANEFAKKAYTNAPEHLLEQIGQSLLFIDQNQIEKNNIADQQAKSHS